MMDSIAASVSLGEVPVGDVATKNRLPQASDRIMVTQPARALESVEKFAIVGV